MSALSHVAVFALGGAVALGGAMSDQAPYAVRSPQPAPKIQANEVATITPSFTCIAGDVEALQKAGLIEIPRVP